MAKKKKKRKKRSKKITDLPALGQKYLAKGQFAEAIKIFRRLHSEGEDERYSKLFSRAFIGRVNQLLAKGMPKESLIILENMEDIFPNMALGLRILLLAKVGKYQEAVQKYLDVLHTLSKQQKKNIDEFFAALLLGGQTELEKLLPDDSLICSHYCYAKQALRAYCRQDDDETRLALHKITFRSPYKNFRLALQGMLAFHGERHEALSYFEKISPHSPFLRFTVPYSQLAGKEKDPSIKLTTSDRNIIHSLEGLDMNTIQFLEVLSDVPGMTPAILYQKLVSSGKCLGQKQLSRICYRLLPHAPSKKNDFQKRFRKLSSLKDAHLHALTMEVTKQYSCDIEEAWLDVCHELIEQGEAGEKPKIALIYQHIAEIMERDSFEYDLRDVEEVLEKSLAFDPYDKDTWLKLVDLRHHSLAKRYKIVNSMLEKFPEDTEILLLGVEATIQRGAFKKASGIAGRLLKIDPLNSRVRMLLIDAHLSHARKLAKQKKYQLACRECESAASFDKRLLSHGKISLCHGLLTLLSGDEERGLQLLAEGEQQAAHPLLAHFEIRLEAELYSMALKWIKLFTSRLKKTVKLPLEKDVFLQLVDIIAACDGKKHFALQNFRSILTPCLKKGALLGLSKDEFKRVCRTFKRRHYYDLLQRCAGTALKKFPGAPLFVFYEIYAKTGGGEKRLSHKLYNILENAWDDAMNEGDRESASMIDDLLNQQSPGMGLFGGAELDVIQKLMGGHFADHLENGTEPSDEEIEQFVLEMDRQTFPEEEQPKPEKKKKSKNRKKPVNPKQLNLFE